MFTGGGEGGFQIPGSHFTEHALTFTGTLLYTMDCGLLLVPDPSKGVCADPVNRDAILEGGGPGPPGGNKERQLSPDKGRGKT